jgi:hypothetical protein
MANNASADNRGPSLEVVSAVFVALAFMTAVARFYTRAFIVRSFGTDDWAMVCALVRASSLAETQVFLSFN